MDRPTLQLFERLESTLEQSVQRQDQLAGLLERKRLALRQGAVDEMNHLCSLEGSLVKAIGELERSRTQLVAALAKLLLPQAAAPVKMVDLAEALPEPHRGRLLVTRAKLVEAMTRVQQRSSVVRRASEALAQHVGGLIRTIGVVSQGGAAYGQTGRVQARPSRMSTLNLTA